MCIWTQLNSKINRVYTVHTKSMRHARQVIKNTKGSSIWSIIEKRVILSKWMKTTRWLNFERNSCKKACFVVFLLRANTHLEQLLISQLPLSTHCLLSFCLFLLFHQSAINQFLKLHVWIAESTSIIGFIGLSIILRKKIDYLCLFIEQII